MGGTTSERRGETLCWDACASSCAFVGDSSVVACGGCGTALATGLTITTEGRLEDDAGRDDDALVPIAAGCCDVTLERRATGIERDNEAACTAGCADGG